MCSDCSDRVKETFNERWRDYKDTEKMRERMQRECVREIYVQRVTATERERDTNKIQRGRERKRERFLLNEFMKRSLACQQAG